MKKSCIDLQGRQFDSYAALCRANNFSYKLFMSRISAGWSVEKILSTPKKAADTKAVAVSDHEDNHYSSTRKMCSAYGINPGTFKNRVKNGASIKDALTAPRKYANRHVDHTGREFKNVQEMCQHWNIPRATFYKRLNDGWSLEDALTIGGLALGDIQYNNRTYKTLRALCRGEGVKNYERVFMRISRGLSVANALKLKIKGADQKWHSV